MQAAILKERQIVDKAIDALTTHFPMLVEWETAHLVDNKQPIDGFLLLQNKRIAAEVKGDFRMHQLVQLLAQKAKHEAFILIVNVLSENSKAKLKELGINYLDTAGNAFIFYPPIAIAIDGKKKAVNRENLKDKAFTKAGMRLVFAYLKNETLIHQPYRDIAKIVGVSIDTITKTNESLKQQGFIRQLTDKKIALTDTKKLFEKWADVYETRIKPKLFYEKFSFLNTEAERNWKTIPLSKNACWGGEAAADLQTNFIRPAIFTLYSTESKVELMKQYRLKPDTKGNIQVYLPFTTNLEFMREEQATHPILTYADLLNTGEPRNLEVAQKLYENHVKIFF